MQDHFWPLLNKYLRSRDILSVLVCALLCASCLYSLCRCAVWGWG